MTNPNYISPQDIELRLHNSVVRLAGRPVHVLWSGKDLILEAHDLLSKEKREIDANTPELDVSCPPLGWCNYKDGPKYLYRSPHRYAKAGLDYRNLEIDEPDFDAKKLSQAQIMAFLKSKELGETIVGSYPSFNECRVRKGGAWTRQLALAQIGGIDVLFYNSFALGIYDKRKNVVQLQDKYWKVPPILTTISNYVVPQR